MTNTEALMVAILILFSLLTVSYCMYKQEEKLEEGLKRLSDLEKKIKKK